MPNYENIEDQALRQEVFDFLLEKLDKNTTIAKLEKMTDKVYSMIETNNAN